MHDDTGKSTIDILVQLSVKLGKRILGLLLNHRESSRIVHPIEFLNRGIIIFNPEIGTTVLILIGVGNCSSSAYGARPMTRIMSPSVWASRASSRLVTLRCGGPRGGGISGSLGRWLPSPGELRSRGGFVA